MITVIIKEITVIFIFNHRNQEGNVLKCLEKDYGVRYPIGIKEVDKGKIP